MLKTKPHSMSYYKEYYIKNRDRILARRREKHPETKKGKAAYDRRHVQEKRRSHPDYYPDQKLKSRYGIPPGTYRKMLELQNGNCLICDISESAHGKRLFVDHCHTTGTVRGLLCNECNKGLGCFKDNPEYFLKAIEYLKSR